VLGALEYLEWPGKQFGAEHASAWKEAGFSGRKFELKKGMSAMHMSQLDERVPTASFTLEGRDPEQLADALVERLGLLEAGGMSRVGPVHYNTLDELEKFGEVLKKVAK
jgi:selenocysteine lyase/cysteine desulfurase